MITHFNTIASLQVWITWYLSPVLPGMLHLIWEEARYPVGTNDVTVYLSLLRLKYPAQVWGHYTDSSHTALSLSWLTCIVRVKLLLEGVQSLLVACVVLSPQTVFACLLLRGEGKLLRV